MAKPMKKANLQRIPVIPSRNAVIFPGRTLPLSVGRKKSIAALKNATESDNHAISHLIVTIAQKRNNHLPNGEDIVADDLYSVGTLCKIDRFHAAKDHQNYQVVLSGIERVRVLRIEDVDGCLFAEIESFADDNQVDEATRQILLQSLKDLSLEILALIPADTRQVQELVKGIEDLDFITYLSTEHLDVPLATKQGLLEMVEQKDRVMQTLDLMKAQKEVLEVQGNIRERLGRKLSKAQRENILREQLRAIREELGEGDEESSEAGYREKIEEAKMTEEARKIALEEAKRLESISSHSPESHVIRNYLDLLLAMPWQQSTPDSIDLERAAHTLNSDHYGLDKIKRRILQHLAVLKLRPNGKGSILLFVGPPGVGKTSLGQSIAKSLDRKFVRVSLGGVRDESEIRGHRRTYVGAMPGRIIQGLKRAGVNNPVFLLDEIDKLGTGYSGDPAAALLEVLDPEQNHTFTDHYLDVPFDLSKIFFIATANSVESIPPALMDRMEVIELTGYTTLEKMHIAKSHLLPKQLEDHGIKPEQVAIDDQSLTRVITHFTREAGVRELQRKISELCRASAEKIVAPHPKLPVVIKAEELEDLLGREKFQHEVAEEAALPGVVTGLAWTPLGGEILFIEGRLMPGTGKLMLTGQLGEVMKESAHIALSLARSNLSALVPGFEFEKNDIHIHVPAGAIPKDGPSAGVAMLTTLASLFTGKPVAPNFAMTGEITLRGAVTPVGGIKEKVIAAHRAGIKTVILPKKNEKDLKDVPAEVREGLTFIFAEHVTDVLRATLGLEGAFHLPITISKGGARVSAGLACTPSV